MTGGLTSSVPRDVLSKIFRGDELCGVLFPSIHTISPRTCSRLFSLACEGSSSQLEITRWLMSSSQRCSSQHVVLSAFTANLNRDRVPYLLCDRTVTSDLLSLVDAGEWNHALCITANFGILRSRSACSHFAAVIALVHAKKYQDATRLLGESPVNGWTYDQLKLNIKYCQKHVPRNDQWFVAASMASVAQRDPSLAYLPGSIVNILLRMLGHANRWEDCLSLLNRQIVARTTSDFTAIGEPFVPSCATITAICSALHGNSNWSYALQYSSRILSYAQETNVLTVEAVEALLSVCTQGQRWLEAVQLVSRYEQHMNLSVEAYMKLLRLVNTQKATPSCLGVKSNLLSRFAAMHDDDNAYNTALNVVLEAASSTGEVLNLLEQLEHRGASLFEAGFNNALFVLLKSRSWERALSLTSTHPHLVSALTHDYLQCGLSLCSTPSWEVSLGLFTAFLQKGVPVSEVAFKCCSSICLRQNQDQRAQDLLFLVVQKGVQNPNATSDV